MIIIICTLLVSLGISVTATYVLCIKNLFFFFIIIITANKLCTTLFLVITISHVNPLSLFKINSILVIKHILV